MRSSWIIGGALVSLCGCGATSDTDTRADREAHDGEATDQADDEMSGDVEAVPPANLPALAPRWVAVFTRDDAEPPNPRLSIVRFDDPLEPETFALAGSAEEYVTQDWVRWSPSGSHVAFVTCDRERLLPSLSVASATDDFERRAIGAPLQFEATTEAGCRDVMSYNSIAWMGSDTLFAVILSSDQMLYYRIPVGSGEPELIGEIDSRQPFTASPFGVLYTLGTSSGVWDLWFAGETGEPQRMGTKPEALLFTRQGPLTWSPDGQRAWWWTHWPDDGSPTAATHGGGELPPPQVEIVPDQIPKIGRIHVPTGLVVDQHPHGDLSAAYEFNGYATSPTGAAVAYAVYRRPVAAYAAERHLTIVRDSGQTPIREGIGSSTQSIVGFIDDESLFFSVSREPQEPDGDRSVAIVVEQGGVSRELSVDRYAPRYMDVLRQSNRLFFARQSAERRASLWTVNLDDAEARAEPVVLEGSVIGDSLLKQGQIQPALYDKPAEAERGQALLVATSDDDECLEINRGCQTARWVVNFDGGPSIAQLQDRWVPAVVSWSPDGTGLVAVAEDGLSYIPGPDYRGWVQLEPGAVSMVVPVKWPAAQ